MSGTVTELGKLGKFMRGSGISKSDIVADGGIPCVRYAEIYTEYGEVIRKPVSMTSREAATSALKLESGDIIFPTSGETAEEIGKAAAFVGHQEAYVGGDTVVLRGHGQNAIFLAHALNTWDANRQKFRFATGNSVVHIYQTELSKIQVWLPTPNEQQKIVEILSDCDAAIEILKYKISKSLEKMDAVRQEFITKAGFQKQKLQHFLIQNTERVGAAESGVVLSVTNQQGFVLAEDKFGHRVASADLSNYKIVNKGDFAYNPSRLNVGSIARLDEFDAGLVSPMYVVFRLRDEKLNSDFFRHWLATSEAKQRIKRATQGSVRESVSFSDLTALPMPSPPLLKQLQIAKLLDGFVDDVKNSQKNLKLLKKQKRGLMQQLLTGKLCLKGAA